MKKIILFIFVLFVSFSAFAKDNNSDIDINNPFPKSFLGKWDDTSKGNFDIILSQDKIQTLNVSKYKNAKIKFIKKISKDSLPIYNEDEFKASDIYVFEEYYPKEDETFINGYQISCWSGWETSPYTDLSVFGYDSIDEIKLSNRNNISSIMKYYRKDGRCP